MKIPFEIVNLISQLGPEESLKRLEGVEGSERRLVTPPRSEGGTIDAETEGEDAGVTPGEAEEAYREAMRLIRKAEAMDNQLCADFEERGDTKNSMFYGLRADAFSRSMEEMEDWLPQPDSEAKRSGRRNDQVEARD